MRLYYRISDKSYEKPKLIGITKEICLMNFVKAFHEVIFGTGESSADWVPPVRIIADRCERKTITMLSQTGMPITITDLGNAGSLKKALELAVEENKDDELVYFCEDDYLHLGCAPKLLEEGIKRSHYVSLYDHPDKYTPYYNLGEYSKVIKTASSHWRFTVSTCMTFGTTVKTLKEDMDIWLKFTDGVHPHDHFIFTDLGKRGRKLAIPIPGVACHCCLEFSGRSKKIHIDPWAIDIMINELENQLTEKKNESEFVELVGNKTGWDKLVTLDALRKHFGLI